MWNVLKKDRHKLIKEILPNGMVVFHRIEPPFPFHPAFMDKEYLEKAKDFRQSQRVMYPDMRQLTDESKAMLRREKHGITSQGSTKEGRSKESSIL